MEHNFSKETQTRYLILPVWLIAIYCTGLLMSESATICLWIVSSFFLFVLLDPAVERLKARGWPTAVAAVVLVLIASIIMVGTVYVFGHLFSRMLIELEQSKRMLLHAFDSLNSSWNVWMSKIPGFHNSATDVNPDVSKVEIVQSSPLGGELGNTILHGLGSAATILGFSLLTPILAFFFLAERDCFGQVLKKAYSKTTEKDLIWNKIVKATQAFFVGNLVLGLITYPLFILLFWFFKVPSVFTVAALATFFNLIPFAGAVLTGVLPALSLYTQTQAFGGAIAVYTACIAIHFIIADLITPKLLGSQVNINATTSTIALVAWGELWGAVGLILAIPLTSLIKILFETSNFYWLQWIAQMMSADVDTALKAPMLRMTPKSESAE